MQKYVNSLSRILYAGLFFVVSVVYADDVVSVCQPQQPDSVVVVEQAIDAIALAQEVQPVTAVAQEIVALDMEQAIEEAQEPLLLSGRVVTIDMQPTGTKLSDADLAKAKEKEKYIRIASGAYDNGAFIEMKPGAYALSLDNTLFVGAPEDGYYASTLVKIASNGIVIPLARAKVTMNQAKNQSNPFYNKKIKHVASNGSTLYIVTHEAPHMLYRYTGYEHTNTGVIYSYAIHDATGNECSIERIACGVIGNAEYIIAHVVSKKDPNISLGLACIKSYAKKLASEKKTEEQKAAEKKEAERKEAEQKAASGKPEKELTQEQKKKKEEEEEEKKTEYKFVGVDISSGKEEVSCIVPFASLLGSAFSAEHLYSLTDIQINGKNIYFEFRVHNSSEHVLFEGTIFKNKGAFKRVHNGFYHRIEGSYNQSAWRKAIGTRGFVVNDQAYALVVGSLEPQSYSSHTMLALPFDEKNKKVYDQTQILHVAGGMALPGPISDVRVAGDTVYAAVVGTEQYESAGIYYSQAIIDGSGAVAAWTPWQHVAGTTDPVFAMLFTGSNSFIIMSPLPQGLYIHSTKWRGPFVEKIEKEVREKLEARLKEYEKKRIAALEEAEKERLAKLTPAEKKQEDEKKKMKKEEEEKADPVCYFNGSLHEDRKPCTYKSSMRQLCDTLEKQFASANGGVKALCDMPRTAQSPASFLIACGEGCVLIAQANGEYAHVGQQKVRSYANSYEVTDGTFNVQALQELRPEAVTCKGGVLGDLMYLDFVHVATSREYTWIFVGGPRGVAVLQTEDGSGLDARVGFGDRFTQLYGNFSFKKLGTYEWLRGITSDDQFVYIITDDSIDRIPLKKESFVGGLCPEVCTIATIKTIGAVCNGYMINDVIVSHGMMLVATPYGLVSTEPGIDCRTVTHSDELMWHKVQLPEVCGHISRLIPVSSTGHVHDVFCKGQVLVVSRSFIDDISHITRLYLDKENMVTPIAVVPDVKNTRTSSWINYLYRIDHFYSDGAVHVLAHSRLENVPADLAYITPFGAKRNAGYPQKIVFNADTQYVNCMVRSSATGTLFVAADDGVRIYE